MELGAPKTAFVFEAGPRGRSIGLAFNVFRAGIKISSNNRKAVAIGLTKDDPFVKVRIQVRCVEIYQSFVSEINGQMLNDIAG